MAEIYIKFLFICLLITNVLTSRQEHHQRNNRLHSERHHRDNDLCLWINEQQVKQVSGFDMKIFAIDNGKVSPHIKDPNFNHYLPTIPSEVSTVNFTWSSGIKKYYYDFDRLQSLDENILKPPTISIKTKGRVPREPKQFSVTLPCSGNNSGTVMFNIGLLIQTRKGKSLPGTPLRFSLRKECAHRGVYRVQHNYSLTSSQGPNKECNKKCANNGWCNHDKMCQCPEGYMGEFCQTALCFPQCLNGGNCTSPAVCSCVQGYHGSYCEGGICSEKCLNGGKCIQKDKCKCSKGYYGLRCEYSKCFIPCMNGGKCIGDNKCRCLSGLGGNHCEIGRIQRSTCKKPCKHGICTPEHICKCHEGFYGRFCNQKEKRNKNKPLL